MRKNQKGFTLIELIVVSAIIGALAALAIPQYANYRQRAERASMLSYARSLYRGFILYYIEDPDSLGAGYPLAVDPPAFNLTTLSPLSNRGDGQEFLDFDVDALKSKIKDGKCDAYDSPDDPIINGEFYLVLTMATEPNTRFFISQTDELPGYAGQWLDGVFIEKDGAILY